MRIVTLIAAALLAPLLAAACGTIEPGPPTGPPPGCNASPVFFHDHVWPEYLDRFGCGSASCHDARSGHGYFRLQPVAGVAAFDPATPISSWPDAWRFDLLNATRLLNCADPTSSQLLAVPEGKGQPHPGGDAVCADPMMLSCQTDHTSAETLFLAWAGAL